MLTQQRWGWSGSAAGNPAEWWHTDGTGQWRPWSECRSVWQERAMTRLMFGGSNSITAVSHDSPLVHKTLHRLGSEPISPQSRSSCSQVAVKANTNSNSLQQSSCTFTAQHLLRNRGSIQKSALMLEKKKPFSASTRIKATHSLFTITSHRDRTSAELSR